MRKTVIVMPYFDRQYQVNKTFESLKESKHDNFSVVVIDDYSPQEIELPSLPFKVDIIHPSVPKTWTNCSPVWNIGFHKALEQNPEIIILQSAECFHVGDLLSHADDNLTDDNYLAYGCFQIDRDTTFGEYDIDKLSKACNYKVSTCNGGKGQNAWWNHSIYEPQPQYWGCAITAKSLVAINGIDERFAYGYAIEDGYFLHQLNMYGLMIEIIDHPFVVHQWHSRIYPPNIHALVNKNKALQEELEKSTSYRAKHIITPDLVWNGI